jgi:hypothetical protein
LQLLTLQKETEDQKRQKRAMLFVFGEGVKREEETVLAQILDSKDLVEIKRAVTCTIFYSHILIY